MIQPILSFMAVSEENGDVLKTLGIDAKLLVFQIVGFVILVWLLSKYVFPVFVRAIDERQKTIETGLKEAAEARAALQQAESRADALLIEARKEADALLARAQSEAADQLRASEDKAKERAEQIVADARTTLAADVRKARQALQKDTVALVAAATEHVVRQKIDSKADAEIIRRAIAKEAR